MILKLLTGAGGGWILAAALLVAAALGGGAGYVTRGVIDAPIIAKAHQETAEATATTERCKAVHEKVRADNAEAVVTALVKASETAAAAMNDLASKERARGRSLQNFINEVNNVPSTRVCGSSAPERAYRVRVQGAVPAVAP